MEGRSGGTDQGRSKGRDLRTAFDEEEAPDEGTDLKEIEVIVAERAQTREVVNRPPSAARKAPAGTRWVCIARVSAR